MSGRGALQRARRRYPGLSRRLDRIATRLPPRLARVLHESTPPASDQADERLG